MTEELNGIMLKEKEKKLIMNRVPKQTKEMFIAIAEDEFVGDYGLTLKAILEGYLTWKVYFENMDMKLDKILLEINSGSEENTDKNSITMMSGRIVEKEVNKK